MALDYCRKRHWRLQTRLQFLPRRFDLECLAISPNIHGSVDGYQALETATGAFSIDNMAGSPVGTGVMKNHRFLFNASLYSRMYQDGATVQAPALTVLPCIRV